jgi:hypothetical protein
MSKVPVTLVPSVNVPSTVQTISAFALDEAKPKQAITTANTEIRMLLLFITPPQNSQKYSIKYTIHLNASTEGSQKRLIGFGAQTKRPPDGGLSIHGSS